MISSLLTQEIPVRQAAISLQYVTTSGRVGGLNGCFYHLTPKPGKARNKLRSFFGNIVAGLESVTCSVIGIGIRTTRAVTGCTYQIYIIDIKTALVAIVRTGTVLLPQKGFLCYTFYASESAVGAKVHGISRSLPQKRGNPKKG